jgi:hypothetical protein
MGESNIGKKGEYKPGEHRDYTHGSSPSIETPVIRLEDFKFIKNFSFEKKRERGPNRCF